MASCSRAVFRCFKCLERAADRITGVAGPFFVVIAYILLTMGAATFCKSLTERMCCKPSSEISPCSRSSSTHASFPHLQHPHMHFICHQHVCTLLLRVHGVARVRKRSTLNPHYPRRSQLDMGAEA